MRAKAALALLVLTVAVACGPTAAPRSTTPAASPTVNPPRASTPQPALPTATVSSPTATRSSVPTPGPTLAPLDVQIKSDEKLGATSVISTTGGTVQAQAADGTRYTLALPKDALLQDTQITLIPLAGVDRLPFSGGLAGGVQMLPEGLRLYQPATLTIDSRHAAPAKGLQLVAFGYHQNGAGFYLTPSEVKGQTVNIPIWHFSGAGVASGTAEEIKTQERRVPADAEDVLSQRMSEYLLQEQELQQLGLDPDPKFKENMVGYLREAFNLLKPQLAIAVQDCEASKTILPKALTWTRQVELWGFGEEFKAEEEQVFQALGDAIVNCYNKAYDKCVQGHDVNQISIMLGLLRQATLLSPAAGGGIAARLDQSKVERCGTFELTFDTTLTVSISDPVEDIGWKYRAHTVVPGVRLSLLAQAKPATAPLDLIGDTPTYSSKIPEWSCVFGGAPSGSGTLSVSSLKITADQSQNPPGAPQVSLNLDPLNVQESLPVVTCTEANTGSESGNLFSNAGNFSISFNDLHRKELGAQGDLIADWQVGNGSAFARKNYAQSISNDFQEVQVAYSENTTFELVHKPE